MKASAPGAAFLGRDEECRKLDRLLDRMRGGASEALVLWGEPGIGKSALLEYAVGAAFDMRVFRCEGRESSFGRSFAGLRQLLDPLAGDVARLPEPQKVALGSALGLRRRSSPDTFLVGRAVLTLLDGAGRDAPVLCAVDDAEFLDAESAQVLAFVAGRLEAEGLALLFCVNELNGNTPLAALPRLYVRGLPDEAARVLLAGAIAVPIANRVGDAIVSELAGNPRALLELPSELTEAQLEGEDALPEPLPLGQRLERSYLQRLHRLPHETQQLLLVVAAEPGGDLALLERVAAHLGLSAGAVGSLEESGLLRVGKPMGFRHSFVRAAVYGAASARELQRAHSALAAATDAAANPDRRAWHLGAAAAGPDEEIAVELERAAEQAIELRGYAAAAALLERAAQLTPDEAEQGARGLVAARAALTAGRPQRAAALLERAAPKLEGELERAQALSLRGSLALALGENGHTSSMLLRAAKAFEPFDVRLARDTHLEALTVAIYAGRLARRGTLLEVTHAARAAPWPAEGDLIPADLLLEGLAVLMTDGHAAAAPTLRQAIELLREEGEVARIGLAGHAASELWDDDALHALAARRVRLARDTGALAVLPNALSQLGGYELLAGRFDAAEACFDEAGSISATTGNPGIVGAVDPAALYLAAWRGQEEKARQLAEAHARDATARGVGILVNLSFNALAVLENALGHYEAALTAAREACDGDPFWVSTRTLPELVEAAVRSREPEIAAAAVERLSATALPTGTEWGLGMLARSRALVCRDGDAQELYEDAISHLKRCRAVPELARARLVYGEWLRRRRRRREARRQLRVAHESLRAMGAEAFAERAGTELLATGERIRRRTPVASELLTPHELRIARLASEGASNPEIAAQLFVSPRTVEYHLHKVFRKLEISSRTQLPNALHLGEPETSQD